jgi:hypothetical protein
MASSVLLCSCESWTMTQHDSNNIQAAEMKFVFMVKSCTKLDKFHNEDIRKDIQIYSINNTIKDYRVKWFQHTQQMNDAVPKTQLKYRHKEQRSQGRQEQMK